MEVNAILQLHYLTLAIQGEVFLPSQQSAKYVHSCLVFGILIKMSTNIPKHCKSMILQAMLGLTEDSRTTDSGCKVAWSVKLNNY